jgi:hypothetical protein
MTDAKLRLRLKTSGYAPVPLNGKRPAMDKWQRFLEEKENGKTEVQDCQ